MLGVEFEENPWNGSQDTAVKVNQSVGTRILNLNWLLLPNSPCTVSAVFLSGVGGKASRDGHSWPVLGGNFGGPRSPVGIATFPTA